MAVFLQVILPVFVIFLSGYFIQQKFQLNVKEISTVSIYILLPALTLRTFYEVPINKNYVYVLLFLIVLLFISVQLSKLYTKMNKLSMQTESALILSTGFMNTGNYGVPIILFAYGEAGFHFAVMVMVLQTLIMNSFGVYYAARSSLGLMQSLYAVFRMPATYAAMIGIGANALNLNIPENMFTAIDLVADATIPLAMIMLGMQLADIRWRKFDWRLIGFATFTRLILTPILAFFIVYFFDIDPLLKKVLIALSAMPVAVTVTMYSIQFDAEPDLVSSITVITTILSAVTIAILLIILGI